MQRFFATLVVCLCLMAIPGTDATHLRRCPPVPPAWNKIFDNPDLAEFSELIQAHFRCDEYPTLMDEHTSFTVLAPVNDAFGESFRQLSATRQRAALAAHIIPTSGADHEQSPKSLVWNTHPSISETPIKALTKGTHPLIFSLANQFSVSPSITTSAFTTLVTPNFTDDDKLKTHIVDAVLIPREVPANPWDTLSCDIEGFICPITVDFAIPVADCSECVGKTETVPGSVVCGAMRTITCSESGCSSPIPTLAGNVVLDFKGRQICPHSWTKFECLSRLGRCPSYGSCVIEWDPDGDDVFDDDDFGYAGCPLCGPCVINCYDDCDVGFMMDCPRHGDCYINMLGSDDLDDGAFVQCPDVGDCIFNKGSSGSHLDEGFAMLASADGTTKWMGSGWEHDEGMIIGRGKGNIIISADSGGLDESFLLVGAPEGKLDVLCDSACQEGSVVVDRSGSSYGSSTVCEVGHCHQSFAHFCDAPNCDLTCPAGACHDRFTSIGDSVSSPDTTTQCTSGVSCASVDRGTTACADDGPCTVTGDDLDYNTIVCPKNGDCDVTLTTGVDECIIIGPRESGAFTATMTSSGDWDSVFYLGNADSAVITLDGGQDLAIRGPNNGPITVNALQNGALSDDTVFSCGARGDCIVNCGTDTCNDDSVIIGPEEEGNLEIFCGTDACEDDLAIICPRKGDCVLHCTGTDDDSCSDSDSMMYCPREGACVIECAKSDPTKCGNMIVICPRDNPTCDEANIVKAVQPK